MNTRVIDDYAGSFDPDWTLDCLSRAALARLCRERMVVSMFHDRALMPHIAVSYTHLTLPTICSV